MVPDISICPLSHLVCLPNLSERHWLQGVMDPQVVTDSGQSGDGHSTLWWSEAGCDDQAKDGDVYLSIVKSFGSVVIKQLTQPTSPGKTEVNSLLNLDVVLATARWAQSRHLTPAQFDQVKGDDRLVFISGPPGTGKNEMLVRKALAWLKQGDDVCILVLWDGNEAVSRDIHRRIMQHGKLLPGTATLLHCNLPDPDFCDVIKASATKDMKFIVPEASWLLTVRWNQLRQVIGKFCLWASSRHRCPVPAAMTKIDLTHSLSCPPVVVSELELCPAFTVRAMLRYTPSHASVPAGLLPPTDGPPVKRICHSQHAQSEQADVWQCYECGVEVARFLIADLAIGAPLRGDSDGRRDMLKFRDVLISGHIVLPEACTQLSKRDSSTAQSNTIHVQPAGDGGSGKEELSEESSPQWSGFLHGLAETEVPFDVITKGDNEAVERLVSPDEVDLAHVAEPVMVLGLQRPVVVVIGTNDIMKTCPEYVDPRFDVIACCTSQLVLVEGF
ncbi:uncharacterized protein [Littorina saxatilis]|uniref:uncharacterized protein isoform X2 n=1 Tax=Littorina saxatilis TaxID=31220 RepID=UPI0038B44938